MRVSAPWRPRLRQIVQQKSKYVWKARGPRRMLVFGLGNLLYPKTRHSVAQLVIDGLAARFDLILRYESRVLAYHAETRTNVPTQSASLNLKVTFAKTKLLMNDSGRALKKTYEEKLHNTQTFHPRNRRTIILHDSIEQRSCTVSPRFGGSARGHNGVRSVISALGTSDFYRIRLGIGYPPHGMPLDQYVLGKLSREEMDYWSPGGEGVEKVWEAVVKILQEEAEQGREEFKLDPERDMPAMALLPGPFGWRSAREMWKLYVAKVHKVMAAAQARSLRKIQPPSGKPETVFTEKEIAQGREKGKDVVQMLLERLRGKKDNE